MRKGNAYIERPIAVPLGRALSAGGARSGGGESDNKKTEKGDGDDDDKSEEQHEASHTAPSDVDDETLDEGCFYLSRLGLSAKEIGERFEIPALDVDRRIARFEHRVETGEVVEDPASLEFWKSVREEAEGNVKVTFVSGRGFHHSWRSDLKKLDGPTLLGIYESCKDFLNLDPAARFLQYDAPKNYDPLAMQREIAKAVVVVGNLLEEKWKEEQ